MVYFTSKNPDEISNFLNTIHSPVNVFVSGFFIFTTMIVYNVTVKVDHSIHDEWLSYMKEGHIQDVLNTGLFTSCRMCKLLGQNEEDGVDYTLQYTCESMKNLHQYQVQFASKLQQEHINKFGDKALAFRTMMEIEHEVTHK